MAACLRWHRRVSDARDDAAMADIDAEVRAFVLGYLEAHPTAMDTLDGIAAWWIPRRQIEIEVRRVSRMLDALVRDGALEHCEQDGVSFYRKPGASRAAADGGAPPDDAR